MKVKKSVSLNTETVEYATKYNTKLSQGIDSIVSAHKLYDEMHGVVLDGLRDEIDYINDNGLEAETDYKKLVEALLKDVKGYERALNLTSRS